VSTLEQRESASLGAQERALTEHARTQGWEVVGRYRDIASGRRLNGRQELRGALSRLEAGEADLILVQRLDRLTRSVRDLQDFLDASREQGWGIVALDIGLDMTTSTGRMVANLMGTISAWFLEQLSERTTEGLEERRRQGVRLGRPPRTDPGIRRRVRTLHSRGHSLGAIARRLNTEGVPTPSGAGMWYPKSIARLVERRAAQ
jgi:DNA invertase Pin-like site-specific DNA recombinase